jgi:EmrB/QacA subfamily drug resistance transporter
MLGFFLITLDAVGVNVALPSISNELGGGMKGLQWIVAAYTLMFAALLLSAGALSDRVGARRAFGVGLALFAVASVACGAAPTLPLLMAARFLQGIAAALMMPSSMALISQSFPEPTKRAKALAAWGMGSAVAASSAPVMGGALSAIDWRLIFYANVPVTVLAGCLLALTQRSTCRRVPIDWIGQGTAIVAMGSLTYGAIEAGAEGFAAAQVPIAFAIAVVAIVAFVISQVRGAHPVLPHELFRSRNVKIAGAVGFAFMVAFYGLPFVMSLYLQHVRRLSALETGTIFMPMMVMSLVATPFSARLVQRIGARTLIVAALGLMTVGLAVLAYLPVSTPVWTLAALMSLVGIGAPLAMITITGVLLSSVAAHQAGTASGLFNSSRQVGGASAIAVFGSLLAANDNFMDGLFLSLLLAAAVTLTTAAVSLLLRPAELR